VFQNVPFNHWRLHRVSWDHNIIPFPVSLWVFLLRGSTVLERTLATSHDMLLTPFTHLVRLLWMSDQPVGKGLFLHRKTQHRKTNTHLWLKTGFELTISASKRSQPTRQTARLLGPAVSLYVAAFIKRPQKCSVSIPCSPFYVPWFHYP
jgi:hypothetical protein